MINIEGFKTLAHLLEKNYSSTILVRRSKIHSILLRQEGACLHGARRSPKAKSGPDPDWILNEPKQNVANSMQET